MRRIALFIVPLALVAACGGASSSPATAKSGHIKHTKVPVAKSVCSGFRTFLDEMDDKVTPRDQIVLVAYAQSVLKAAIRDSQRIPRPEFLAASNFVAFVGSTSFPTEGNVTSKPIQRMDSFCG